MIVLEDAGLAVLKGAVLYGHKPETIDPRVTLYTYGVEMSTPYITELHEPTRSYVNEFGEIYCQGTFARIIQQNKVVKLGTIVKKTYLIPPNATEISIQFYTSEKDDPIYTDDRSCRKNRNIGDKYTHPIRRTEASGSGIHFWKHRNQR